VAVIYVSHGVKCGSTYRRWSGRVLPFGLRRFGDARETGFVSVRARVGCCALAAVWSPDQPPVGPLHRRRLQRGDSTAACRTDRQHLENQRVRERVAQRSGSSHYLTRPPLSHALSCRPAASPTPNRRRLTAPTSCPTSWEPSLRKQTLPGSVTAKRTCGSQNDFLHSALRPRIACAMFRCPRSPSTKIL
jgi:hypothetical protein